MDTLNDCVRKLKYISLNSIIRFCFENSVNFLKICGDIEKQRNSIFPWELETLLSLAVLAYPQCKEDLLNNNTARNLINVIRDTNLSIAHSDNKQLGKNLLSNIALQQFEYQMVFIYQYYLYSSIFKDKDFSKAIFDKYGSSFEEMSAIVVTLFLYFSAFEINKNNNSIINELMINNSSTIKSLTISVEEYRNMLKKWNFKIDDYRYLLCPLYEKPFLLFDDAITIPLPHVLRRSITSSMLYCITRNNDSCFDLQQFQLFCHSVLIDQLQCFLRSLVEFQCQYLQHIYHKHLCDRYKNLLEEPGNNIYHLY